MNRLSWLLYWADVAPQISTAVRVISFFLMIGFFIGWLLSIFITPNSEQDKAITSTLRKWVWVWPFVLLVYLATWMVPDEKETYYAIAASEVGEQMLKTPEIGKARAALNHWLDEQLKPDKETTDEHAAN